jgi:diaminopimelate epimerase
VSDRLLKVEGAGNDFVLGVGSWARRLAAEPALVVRLCERRRGVGADGALAVFASGRDRLRLEYRNADGSRGAFCANATRCAARVGVEILGLEPRMEVATDWAGVTAVVHGAEVTLELPEPSSQARELSLEVAGRRWQGWFLELGVPHLVFTASDLDALDLGAIAPPLRRHPQLGESGANVNFVADLPSGALAMRTWERGVEGETLSCGSGVVASGLLAMARRRVRRIDCRPRSGDSLTVEAVGEPPCCRTRLTGPTRMVAAVEPTQELLHGV